MSSPVYRRVLLSVAVAIIIVATIVGFQALVRPASETSLISRSERRPAHEPSRSGRVEGSEDPDVVPDAELDGWLRQAGRDTPGTLAKVVALTDSSRRRELLEWILAAWTTEDREPALDWLARTLVSLPEEVACEAVEILIGAWAAEEPLDALEWVKRSVPAQIQTVGFATIAETWAQFEPEAMGDWILAQRSPPDLWARELVHALIPSDPPRALDWCDRLTDDSLAEESRQSAIQSWLLTDPGAADAYLDKHPELVPKVRPENPPPPP